MGGVSVGVAEGEGEDIEKRFSPLISPSPTHPHSPLVWVSPLYPHPRPHPPTPTLSFLQKYSLSLTLHYTLNLLSRISIYLGFIFTIADEFQ